MHLLIILNLMIIGLGCSTISVSSDYDTETDFSNLRTFDFVPAPVQSNFNTLNLKRVHDAVKSQ